MNIVGHRVQPSPNTPTDGVVDVSWMPDWVKKAEKGELRPVFGRQAELRQVISILMQTKKSNAILLGEPGVGKTAIVEELARRIAAKRVPVKLQRPLFCLDLGALVAGAKQRGEFAARLTRVLTEAKGAILFIDEIHLAIGAGREEGAMDAANLLKPMLARGDLCCIGATTHVEYHRHVEKDEAFARRFKRVDVHPPSVEETIR